MNTYPIAEATAPVYSHAFGGTLSIEELRRRTPAVFAGNASARTKPTYRFINTAGVLEALLEAGKWVLWIGKCADFAFSDRPA